MARHYMALISSAFGSFAAKAFPRSIQKLINKSYVTLLGLDMSEFQPPQEYPTLGALFTRALKKERLIVQSNDSVISPADSLVTDLGEIKEGRAYQIKGMEYRIDALLGDYFAAKLALLEGGSFVNLYLSPKDYHRYHIPLDLQIKSLTHIPGKLYPVNMPLLRHKHDLFIENERVVIECIDTKGNLHMIVLVGALNVGKMVVSFEEQVKTNSEIRQPRHYSYSGLKMAKGELFGWFEMGSTILLMSQKGALKLEVTEGQKVRFGEEIAKIN